MLSNSCNICVARLLAGEAFTAMNTMVTYHKWLNVEIGELVVPKIHIMKQNKIIHFLMNLSSAWSMLGEA